MSQFRDTFTKEEQREPLLDYDDSAFLFYLCTVSVCFLVPWSFFSLRDLFFPNRRVEKLFPTYSRSGALLLHCDCSQCTYTRAAAKRRLRRHAGFLGLLTLFKDVFFFIFRRLFWSRWSSTASSSAASKSPSASCASSNCTAASGANKGKAGSSSTAKSISTTSSSSNSNSSGNVFGGGGLFQRGGKSAQSLGKSSTNNNTRKNESGESSSTSSTQCSSSSSSTAPSSSTGSGSGTANSTAQSTAFDNRSSSGDEKKKNGGELTKTPALALLGTKTTTTTTTTRTRDGVVCGDRNTKKSCADSSSSRLSAASAIHAPAAATAVNACGSVSIKSAAATKSATGASSTNVGGGLTRTHEEDEKDRQNFEEKPSVDVFGDDESGRSSRYEDEGGLVDTAAWLQALWVCTEKILLLVAWLAVSYLCYNLPEMKSLKTFDPFDILEISVGATNREIKKAYRLMSLKYHPDKNVNDPTSAAKFILVTKAYQSLTDPIAKANYERYGNPDGPGNMKVGMGLPRFLVEEKYQLLVLACFFLFLLVLLPMVFICYYQRQKKYAPNGVLVDTLQFLTHYINEGTRLKNCPEFLAASGESRMMKVEKADDAEMREIIETAQEPKKRALSTPVVVRNYFLILAHMQRLHNLLSVRLQRTLDELLRHAMPITHCMVEICVLSDWLHAAKAMLEFRRCIVQALDGRSSTLLQIPYFTPDLVRHCNRGKNATRDLLDFLRQEPSERKGLLEMNAYQQRDVLAFSRRVSQMNLQAKVFVEDEEEAVVGDIATCEVTLTRVNLQEGEAAGAVHAPRLPVPKYEEWWILVVDPSEAAATGGRILNFVRTKSLERVVEEKIQFRVGKLGKQSVTVMALCDSYAGCDCSVDVEFKAYHPEEKPRDVWVHPEDVRLDEEPTLFQQMLGEMYNSSDEEEEFELEEGSRMPVKKKTAETSATLSTSPNSPVSRSPPQPQKEHQPLEEQSQETQSNASDSASTD